MALNTPTLPFRISVPADRTDDVTVEVDGQDVSDRIDGLRFDVAGAQPAVLTLYGPAAGDIDGEAVVRVMVNGDPRQALVDLLGSISPQQLEQAAMRRLDFDDTAECGLTAAMLRELAEAAGRG